MCCYNIWDNYYWEKPISFCGNQSVYLQDLKWKQTKKSRKVHTESKNHWILVLQDPNKLVENIASWKGPLGLSSPGFAKPQGFRLALVHGLLETGHSATAGGEQQMSKQSFPCGSAWIPPPVLPRTSPPLPGKSCLPWNWSMVPKKLGNSVSSPPCWSHWACSWGHEWGTGFSKVAEPETKPGLTQKGSHFADTYIAPVWQQTSREKIQWEKQLWIHILMSHEAFLPLRLNSAGLEV